MAIDFYWIRCFARIFRCIEMPRVVFMSTCVAWPLAHGYVFSLLSLALKKKAPNTKNGEHQILGSHTRTGGMARCVVHNAMQSNQWHIFTKSTQLHHVIIRSTKSFRFTFCTLIRACLCLFFAWYLSIYYYYYRCLCISLGSLWSIEHFHW